MPPQSGYSVYDTIIMTIITNTDNAPFTVVTNGLVYTYQNFQG